MNLHSKWLGLPAVVLLGAAIVACGSPKSTPAAPSSSNCNGPGVLGSAKGTLTGSISGANFVGGVPTGESIYTVVPAQPLLGLSAQDFFTFTAICGDNTSIQILARAIVGKVTIGVDVGGAPITDPVTKQPLVHQVVLQYRTNGVASGTWLTSQLGGTGSITVSTVSQTAATGSIALAMAPQAGTGATGTKQVSGDFSVTF